jgi:uncharacterized protein (TIGR03437 family)
MKLFSRFIFLLASSFSVLSAQSVLCVTSAVPPIVRFEGLTERTGDIVYTCTANPNTTLTANFSVAMNANITNNISSNNTLTGIVFTADNGSGPQPVLPQPVLTGANSLVYNGVALTFSPQGTLALRIANIRVNAGQVPIDAPILASLGVNGAGLLLTLPQLIVGRPERGLLASFSATLVCAQYGSPLPDMIDFADLIATGTVFATTRITEGFADAFGPKSAAANFNAQTGERFIVTYSGFPSDARLFVPDVIAGSDAITPTAGGDYGLPASGGAWAPSLNGTLLLARVNGADSRGAGGSPVYLPGAGAAAFNTVGELSIVNGSASVVYEVVDADPFSIETAQFPTFLGLLPNGSREATDTTETIFFAPLSTVKTASSTESIPRFAAITPLPDCTAVGDCTARSPQLSVDTTPLNFTAQAGSGTQQGYFTISNTGAGFLHWSATVTYGDASGWLVLDPYAGINNTAVRVYASTSQTSGALAAGVYHATIAVTAADASGAMATQSVPVTFTVTPAPAPPVPAISSVLNGASFLAVPVVPGSISTIMGTNFAGKKISAAFDGQAASILFSNATQINLLVPDLGSKNSGALTVTVDGESSAPQTVAVAPFEPAIFAGAVVNQDSTVNGPGNPAAAGSVIALWATGLSGSGVITAHIADRDIAVPYYAGPAPGFPGVQQVNLVIPGDLAAGTTEVYVCGASGSAAKVCSLPAAVVIR